MNQEGHQCLIPQSIYATRDALAAIVRAGCFVIYFPSV
jgi:hypothetical protein